MLEPRKPAGAAARRLLICALTLVALSAPASVGQASPPPGESFTQFWTRFRAALAKDDRQAVASMTRFRTGDSTYMTDKEFLAEQYGELRRERRCFARSKPVKDESTYSVFCGERIFMFEHLEGAWKFTGIGAND